MVRFSITINGSPSGFFSNSRGLQQGDPFVFFIVCGGVVIEAFSRMMSTTVERGLMYGFEKSRGNDSVTFVICR
jgi:hypothetical protein